MGFRTVQADKKDFLRLTITVILLIRVCKTQINSDKYWLIVFSRPYSMISGADINFPEGMFIGKGMLKAPPELMIQNFSE